MIPIELRQLADEAEADQSLGATTGYVAFALRGREITDALRAAADEIDRLRAKVTQLASA
jgi:hypothetical protein